MTSSAAAVVDDAKRPLLEGRGLSKSFEGNLVLADVRNPCKTKSNYKCSNCSCYYLF